MSRFGWGLMERSSSQDEHAQRLDRAAAAIFEDASCVGQWHVDRLCAESGPAVSAAEAREALERWGVRVAALPRLPIKPPSAINPYPDFADLVAGLGRKLSIELIFGSGIKNGFRLLEGIRLDDGRHLDRKAIEEAQRQTPTDVQHENWNRVLSILDDAAGEPQEIDNIVLWEVTEVLRPLALLGYSQRAITEQAVRVSLERGEAEVLAAAVIEEHEALKPPRPAAIPRTELPAAQADRSPQQARRLDSDVPVATPALLEPLQPVTDLQVRTMRGRTDIVQLSWSPPAAGVVSLRMAGEPTPWSPGTTIPRRDANAYGLPLNASGVPGPDRKMSCELILPQARTFVVPMTVRDADAAVGRTVEVTRQAPVRGLSARRFGDEVRLTWIWPEEATAAYVAWQPSTVIADPYRPSAARQQRNCSRRAFEAEGGFAAKMGHVTQSVEVWAVITQNDQEYVTAPAEIEVPGTGTPVPYDFRSVAGWRTRFLNRVRGRRQRELRLSVELPCVLPDLIVVECRHPTLPLAPHDDNEIAARIPGRPMDPGTPLRMVVELDPDGPSWIACFIDPAKQAAARGRVLLVSPSVKRQRVK